MKNILHACALSLLLCANGVASGTRSDAPQHAQKTQSFYQFLKSELDQVDNETSDVQRVRHLSMLMTLLGSGGTYQADQQNKTITPRQKSSVIRDTGPNAGEREQIVRLVVLANATEDLWNLNAQSILDSIKKQEKDPQIGKQADGLMLLNYFVQEFMMNSFCASGYVNTRDNLSPLQNQALDYLVHIGLAEKRYNTDNGNPYWDLDWLKNAINFYTPRHEGISHVENKGLLGERIHNLQKVEPSAVHSGDYQNYTKHTRKSILTDIQKNNGPRFLPTPTEINVCKALFTNQNDPVRTAFLSMKHLRDMGKTVGSTWYDRQILSNVLRVDINLETGVVTPEYTLAQMQFILDFLTLRTARWDIYRDIQTQINRLAGVDIRTS